MTSSSSMLWTPLKAEFGGDLIVREYENKRIHKKIPPLKIGKEKNQPDLFFGNKQGK